jgi:hypothetical protein
VVPLNALPSWLELVAGQREWIDPRPDVLVGVGGLTQGPTVLIVKRLEPHMLIFKNALDEIHHQPPPRGLQLRAGNGGASPSL